MTAKNMDFIDIIKEPIYQFNILAIGKEVLLAIILLIFIFALKDAETDDKLIYASIISLFGALMGWITSIIGLAITAILVTFAIIAVIRKGD